MVTLRDNIYNRNEAQFAKTTTIEHKPTAPRHQITAEQACIVVLVMIRRLDVTGKCS